MFVTCFVSIGNLLVHFPDMITFVFCIPPGTQTTLIDRILVGKNKSSMNFLSFASDSTSQILSENSFCSIRYSILLCLMVSISVFDKYSTKSPDISLHENKENLSISEFVFASFASFIDASTSAFVS